MTIKATNQYTITDLFDGQDGAPAKHLSLSSNRYTIAFSENNVCKDTSNIILTANQQNYTSDITWSTSPTVTLSGSGKSMTLSTNNFTSNNQIVITITSGGLSDTVTLVKVKDGETGSKGVSILSVDVWYYLSNSPTELTGGAWNTDAPTWVDGKYLWSKTVTTLSDATTTSTKPACISGSQGTTGVGIKSIVEYYMAHTENSGILNTNSSFKTSIPTMTSANKYLWNYELITYTDNSSIKTTARVIGVYGDKGDEGSPGKGISSITNNYLATASSSGVTTSTSGWTTTIQTVTATKKYLWNYETITYTTGSPTATTPCIIGVYGDKGNTGDAGVGVSKVEELFAKAQSKTTIPADSAFTIYNVETHKWEYGCYIWTATKIYYTNGTSAIVGKSCDSSWEAVNKIQVGGRNLVLDTQNYVKFSLPSSASTEGGIVKPLTLNGIAGDNFTVSLRVRGAANLNVYFLMTGGNTAIPLASKSDLNINDYIKKTINFTVPEGRILNSVYICTRYGNSTPGIDYFEIEAKSLKVEKGNKATDWTPAPEDIDQAISEVDKKAEKSKSDLADISNDNKLTASEKKVTKKEWDVIVGEYSKIIEQANKYAVSATTYTSRYNTLSSYISPLLSSLTTTSDVVGATFRSNFANYYNARQDLLNVIAALAKDKIDGVENDMNAPPKYLKINSSVTSIPDSVNGVIRLDRIEGNTVQNLINNGSLASSYASYKSDISNIATGIRIKSIENINSIASYYFSRNRVQLVLNKTYTIICNMDWDIPPVIDPQIYNTTTIFRWKPIKGVNIQKFTIPIGTELAELRLIFYANHETIGSYLDVTNLMILEGDWTNKEIPPYFEGIRSVNEGEESMELVSCGKNLFNENKLEGGEFVTFNGKRCYKYVDRASNFEMTLDCKPNTQYTVTYNIMRGEGNESRYVNLRLVYPDGTFTSTNVLPNKVYNVTSEANKTIVRITGAFNFSTTAYIDLETFQIEEGTVATAYEPYKYQKQTINTVEPLRKLPNEVCDYIDVARGKVVRNVGKEIIDESSVSGVYINDTTVRVSVRTLSKKFGFDNIFADKFITSQEVYGDSKIIEGICGSHVSSDIYMRLNKTCLVSADLNGFKSWLKSNPTTVYYELATPTEEDCSMLQYMKQYENNTFSIENTIISPTIDIAYAVSIKDNINFEGDAAVETTTKLTETTKKLADVVTNLDGITSTVSTLTEREQATRRAQSFRYIRDLLNGSTANASNHWVELQVFVGDTNIAKGKLPTGNFSSSSMSTYTDGDIDSGKYVSGGTGWSYLQVDLGSERTDIDMVKVWHYYADSRAYNHKLQVSRDGVTWYELFNSEISGRYKETLNGRTYVINETFTETRLKQAEQKITDDAIISTVSNTIDSKVNNGINNIQIGGRNLLAYSQLAMIYNQKLNRDYTNGIISGTQANWYFQSTLKLKPNTTYTISIEDIVTTSTVYNNGINTVLYDFSTNKLVQTIGVLNTTNNKITFTTVVTVTENHALLIYVSNDNKCDFTIKGLKLELGNKATDWTPAPEDINNAIQNTTPYVEGTQTSVTGSWTGMAPFSELKDGQQITYWLPQNGSGNATLNLTLSNGATTGAVNCYYGGVSRLTTHYGSGSVIQMVYRENTTIGSTTGLTGWWAQANYNSDTYDRLRFNSSIKAKSAVTAGRIIVSKDDTGYYHLGSGAEFDITYPILYAGSSIGSGSTGTNNYTEINFTVTATQSITLTSGKPVYIKGLLTGNLFTPSTNPITQDIPTVASVDVYMLLGFAYSSTGIHLTTEHDLYKYSNDAFKSFRQIAVDANTTANKAASDSSSALLQLTDMSTDNILTPSEKLEINRRWEEIKSEKPSIDKQADVYGISKTNYANAYNNLSNYLIGTNGCISNLKTTTTIVPTTFNSNFNNYYTQRQVILDSVTQKTKEYSTELVTNLKVGGRNLIKNSMLNITNSSYLTTTVDSREDLVAGQKYTFVLKGNVPSGQKFGVWMNEGNNGMGFFPSSTNGEATYITFTAVNPTNDVRKKMLSIYNYPSGTIAGQNATIEWVAMYEGDIKPPLDWMPSPEDNSDNIASVSQEITQKYESAIKQESERIALEVSEVYSSKDDISSLDNTLRSLINQTSEDITFNFNESTRYTKEVDGKLQETIDELKTYIRFNTSGIELGEVGSSFTSLLGNEKLAFMQNGVEIAYISNNKMFITDVEIQNKLTLGDGTRGYFDFIPRENGNLSLKWRAK